MTQVAVVEEEKSQKQQALSKKLSLIIVIGLIGYYVVDNYNARKEQHVNLVQSIIDENFKPTTLKVRHMYVPIYRLVPLAEMFTNMGLLPNKWEGSFGIYSQDDKGYHKTPGDCSDRTFDFNVRQISMSRISGEIDGETVQRITECNYNAN